MGYAKSIEWPWLVERITHLLKSKIELAILSLLLSYFSTSAVKAILATAVKVMLNRAANTTNLTGLKDRSGFSQFSITKIIIYLPEGK